MLPLLLVQDPVTIQAKSIWASKKDTVWRVEVYKDDRWNDAGTAFALTHGTRQYIVTCNHVAEIGKARIKQGLLTKELSFKQLGKMDAAAARVSGFANTAKLSFVQPLVGEKVYAIGFPGDETLTISEGIVNRYDTKIPGYPGQAYIGHSAGLWPGNSGGPLFSESGEIVGINSNGILGSGFLMAAVATGTAFRNELIKI